MTKIETNKRPAFLEYVRELNGDVELMEALTSSLTAIENLDIIQFKRIGLKTYEKDKWSVHKILQHLIDWERIWCYRAVILARKEGTLPDGLDEEIMGENSNADELSIGQLINELKVVRKSTIMLFESFNEKILGINCKFFEYEMPLFTIGYIITAHQIHHFNVIKEKYIFLTTSS